MGEHNCPPDPISCPAFAAAFSPEEMQSFLASCLSNKNVLAVNQSFASHPFGMFLCFKSLPWCTFSSCFSLSQVMAMDLFLLFVGQVVFPLAQQSVFPKF